MASRAAAVAFALVLPCAAVAQEPPLDPRPLCIDWAGVGTVKSTGWKAVDIEGDMLGNGWFHYRMRVIRPLWQARRGGVDFQLFAHTYHQRWRPSIVFRGKAGSGAWQYVGWQPVINGADGRSFIPISSPRNPEYSRYEWRPEGYERFLKPVRYLEPLTGEPYRPDDAEPGYTEVRDGRRITLKGLYLDDLPEMLAAIPADACRRD